MPPPHRETIMTDNQNTPPEPTPPPTIISIDNEMDALCHRLESANTDGTLSDVIEILPETLERMSVLRTQLLGIINDVMGTRSPTPRERLLMQCAVAHYRIQRDLAEYQSLLDVSNKILDTQA